MSAIANTGRVAAQEPEAAFSAEIVDRHLLVLTVAVCAGGQQFVACGSEELSDVRRIGFSIVLERLSDLKTEAWFSCTNAIAASARVSELGRVGARACANAQGPAPTTTHGGARRHHPPTSRGRR